MTKLTDNENSSTITTLKLTYFNINTYHGDGILRIVDSEEQNIRRLLLMASRP